MIGRVLEGFRARSGAGLLMYWVYSNVGLWALTEGIWLGSPGGSWLGFGVGGTVNLVTLGESALAVLILGAIFWLEVRWRGARETELAKLSPFWRGWTRVSEVMCLTGSKVLLVVCVIVLLGGRWFGEVGAVGLLAVVGGFVGVLAVLIAGSKVGFYSDVSRSRRVGVRRESVPEDGELVEGRMGLYDWEDAWRGSWGSEPGADSGRDADGNFW